MDVAATRKLWAPLLGFLPLSLVCCCGCATGLLYEAATHSEQFRGVKAAYSHEDRLCIVYSVARNLPRSRVAWYAREDLRLGGGGSARPCDTKPLHPATRRVATRVPVVRLAKGEPPVLPPNVDMAVFTQTHERQAGALVLLAVREGRVVERRVLLPCSHSRYTAWWFYPPAILTLAVDVATLPLQLLLVPVLLRDFPSDL